MCHTLNQWNAFIRKIRPMDAIGEFRDVVSELREFLLPVLDSIDEAEAPEMFWDPVRHWQKVV